MPYKHSGEIGDVWKHLPLCDILKIESPEKYFETNSAFADYQLQVNSETQYGIFYVYEKGGHQSFDNSTYFKILDKIDVVTKHIYYGSPALAMTILCNDNVGFYFHDIEKEPLDKIKEFSQKINIQDRVNTILGDSISAFLQNSYSFKQNDFIFIDPYEPFISNNNGKTFFNVFIKAYRSEAKTMLWYGYDNLNSKNKIIEKLQTISYELSGQPIYTFDIWQKCMKQNSCTINPGVPGCGIAVANLCMDSVRTIEKFLYGLGFLYSNVIYCGKKTSLCTGYLIL